MDKIRDCHFRVLNPKSQSLVAIVCDADECRISICIRLTRGDRFPKSAGGTGGITGGPVDDRRAHLEWPATEVVVPLQFKARAGKLQNIASPDKFRILRRHRGPEEALQRVVDRWNQQRGVGRPRPGEAEFHIVEGKSEQIVRLSPVRTGEVWQTVTHEDFCVRQPKCQHRNRPVGNLGKVFRNLDGRIIR